MSGSSLNDAIIALMKQVDQAGVEVGNVARTLLVPIELFKTAVEITDSELRSGTANNDINAYSSKYGIRVVTTNYLTSATAWFLMDSSEHLLQWFWRIRPEFKSDFNFDSDAALYKVRIRYSFGWSDWRGVWGSSGEASTYSD